tara:strand:+ start:1214 stop:1468 length:255 start_codon:yes stop_codon:yes gene_type:complete
MILEYAIINSGFLGDIDFSQIHETSGDTLRYKLDNTQFVIKWTEGHLPAFIEDGSVTPFVTMNHEQTLELMATSAWSDNDPDGE